MAKQVRCSDSGMDCDFVIRSEDEDQMVRFVQEHSRETHGKEVSRSDVEGLMTTV